MKENPFCITRRAKKWRFQATKEQRTASAITVAEARQTIEDNVNKDDPRPAISLGHGDPSVFPCFHTTSVAEDAIADTVRLAKYNCYSPPSGILPARRAIADYLNRDLPYNLLPDDVYLTAGCRQAIEVLFTALARCGANILIPRPTYPVYETCAGHVHLEFRHYDLLPEKNWEVDLDAVEALSDENTFALVIINPGNPCGNVFTYQHLQKIAETARKLGIMVISDEIYDHLTFGNTPYVRMGVFGSVVPVITLGSVSKRWMVPGWRLGWLVTCDPNGILKKSGIVDCIKRYKNICWDTATFIQGAVPQLIEKTKEDFFLKILRVLKEDVDILCDTIEEIPSIICPNKPEGSVFVMLKLLPSLLEDINDDMEFCLKPAREESVIVVPGTFVGMKNWLRITFANDPSTLEDAVGRIKAFCHRHAMKQ